jgi:hypothetical protein
MLLTPVLMSQVCACSISNPEHHITDLPGFSASPHFDRSVNCWKWTTTFGVLSAPELETRAQVTSGFYSSFELPSNRNQHLVPWTNDTMTPFYLPTLCKRFDHPMGPNLMGTTMAVLYEWAMSRELGKTCAPSALLRYPELAGPDQVETSSAFSKACSHHKSFQVALVDTPKQLCGDSNTSCF